MRSRQRNAKVRLGIAHVAQRGNNAADAAAAGLVSPASLVRDLVETGPRPTPTPTAVARWRGHSERLARARPGARASRCSSESQSTLSVDHVCLS